MMTLLMGLALIAMGLAMLWGSHTRRLAHCGVVLLVLGWVLLTLGAASAHGRAPTRDRAACLWIDTLLQRCTPAAVARPAPPQGRPEGCPARAWCGCFLMSYFGLSDRSLWLARNWARIGQGVSGPQPGAIVVWRHHVGLIRSTDGDRILVLSGNDGRRVRERWRSTRGVIAYRIRGNF
jgi:hypothetical protein